LQAISQWVEEALWESLRSLPPNEAMVAVVFMDIFAADKLQECERAKFLCSGRENGLFDFFGGPWQHERKVWSGGQNQR